MSIPQSLFTIFIATEYLDATVPWLYQISQAHFIPLGIIVFRFLPFVYFYCEDFHTLANLLNSIVSDNLYIVFHKYGMISKTRRSVLFVTHFVFLSHELRNKTFFPFFSREQIIIYKTPHEIITLSGKTERAITEYY